MYIGNVEITPREILFSTVIICVMIGFGVWLQNPILRHASEDSLETISRARVYDDERFGYIKRTNIGDFLAEGTLISTDSVSIPDIPGYYMMIRKVKER